MSKFNTYFLMSPSDIVDYVKEKLDIFESDSKLSCKEIGDGNLNYVFRVVDEETEKSIIVKQAGEVTRISKEMTLSTNRITIESSILQLHYSYVPELVPKVYLYDDTMKCFIMDDLSDHEILRDALLSYKTFPRFADDITNYIVNTTLPTTDVVMDPKDKKMLLQKYINPELCEITEDLVYSEPYNDYKNRNILFEPNREWIEKEIYGDDQLRLEVAKLKFDFMTNGQALIHGDLHTGSVFVQQASTKVIDPEFAFYGPIGYDVGNVIANLIFAYVNGVIHGQAEFCNWVKVTIKEVVDLFVVKFNKVWDENVTDVMAKEKGFKSWYLDNVLQDTSGVTGLELTRRIVGMAKVKDIVSIKNENDRVRAERICLTLAKEFILNRGLYKNGEQYVNTIEKVLESYPENIVG